MPNCFATSPDEAKDGASLHRMRKNCLVCLHKTHSSSHAARLSTNPLKFAATGGMVTLTGKQHQIPYPIGGYNLCYIRPDANLAAVTEDEYKAPVVAAWQAEIGRVLCYTGEVDGDYTGAIAGWDGVGDFLTSLVRWTAGDFRQFAGRNATYPEGQEMESMWWNFTSILNDKANHSENFLMQRCSGALLGKSQQWVKSNYLGHPPIRSPWTSQFTAVKLCWLPWIGPGRRDIFHFRPSAYLIPPNLTLRLLPSQALETMERLAHATDGKTRINLGEIWDDLPRQPRLLELKPWLLIAALILLLVEILERRTGLIFMRHGWRKAETKTRRIRRKVPIPRINPAISPSPQDNTS